MSYQINKEFADSLLSLSFKTAVQQIDRMAAMYAGAYVAENDEADYDEMVVEYHNQILASALNRLHGVA